MPKLVVLSEGYTGRSYELKAVETTIGRVEDNAFQIADASVSSHHCIISLKGSEVVVKDLGSTNGSFINGEQITEATLKVGQILRLGSIDVRLESGEAEAPKKAIDRTQVIRQGIKREDLEKGANPTNPDTSKLFRRKSDKVNKMFLILAIVISVVICVVLFLVFKRL
jgi:two-component system, NtrC family, sensor kinase